jgi:hypothetical protein
VLCYGKTQAIDEDGRVIRSCEDGLAINEACPVRRFLHIVDTMGMNNVYAGVFRTAALQRTKHEQTFPAADLVLIAELALYGRFHEIPDVLFFRREALGTATKFRTTNELRQLRAPHMNGTWEWPEWRRSFAYYEAVLRAKIHGGEKVRLCAQLAKRVYRKRERLLWELRGNL